MLINPQEFIVEIPDLHPASNDYVNFWRTQKKYSIEGHWLGGHYMSPSLYFYSNLGTIQLNKGNSNVKSFGRPWLRDLEWQIFNYYTACRGFSGFENDDTFSAHYALLDTSLTDEDLERYPNLFKEDGTRKEFVHPYTLLTESSIIHKGRPLFENNAWNGLVLGSRDTGKSYMSGVGIILKEWLFDGATRYDEQSMKFPSAVDITVGAEDSQKSGLLLNKTKAALERLPGSKVINGRYFPSPLTKQYQGSWMVGKHIIADYEKKYPGGWKQAGSQSMIKHRSFKDNPFADQGARNLVIVLEEIGMFGLLKQVFLNTRDNLQDGDRKIGSLWMMGTGGDMEGEGTLDAQQMMYSPGTFDILSFNDEWENRGQIGFFIPAYMSVNSFKNEQGFTDIPKAIAYWEKKRQSVRTSSKGSEELNKLIQYRPMKPSEMFLSRNSNIFPVYEITQRLNAVREHKIYELLEKKVNLYFDPNSSYNGVNYEIDHDLTAINEFPWKSDNTEGCVTLYEIPQQINGVVPQGAYIIGCDPFRDNTDGGHSLAAIYVMKTSKYPSVIGYDEVVASYIGRPYFGMASVNETLYKLSLFYGNAKIYFENAVGNVKDYFEKIKRLDLLAAQPTTVLNRKASYNTNPSVVYGYPMSNDKIKWEAVQYVRTWLLQEREKGTENTKRNLDLITCPYLLKQLAAFNMDGNFDSVMALVGCVIGLEELYNTSRTESQLTQYNDLDQQFLNLFTNNKKLFRSINEKLPSTEIIF